MENKGLKKEDAPGQNKEVTIIVNTVSHEFSGKEITFEEVVTLAYGSYDPEKHSYTVTYKIGQGNKPGGNLVKGGSVKVKDKMIFNVTRTIRS